MKLLALDISTKSTGWFITKRSCGKIVPKVQLSFEEKLVFFRIELLKLLKKYKPDHVVIEDSYYRPGYSIHTLKQLVKFAGVAIEAISSLGIGVDIITASTARKNCCGKHEGKFKKEEVFAYFVDKYGLDDWTFNKHNDITDAMALAWGYKHLNEK